MSKQFSVIKYTKINNESTLTIVYDKIKGILALDYDNLFVFFLNPITEVNKLALD
jgi:hypothetical protein